MSTQQLKAVVTAEAKDKQPNRYEVFKAKLLSAKADLKMYLGSEDAVGRFVSTCVTAVIERPELLNADPASLLTSCKKAARDNLAPDGRQAVLNIYSTKVKDENGRESWVKKVQYLPMVAGEIKVMYEAGCTYVDAAAVYEKDEFRFTRGDQCSLVHVPSGADDPGDIIAAYAVVKMASGEIKREVMWKRDFLKAKAASKSSEKGPWVDWYDQMAIKSVLHRIRKQLDLYSEKYDRMIAEERESLLTIGRDQGASVIDVTDRQQQPEPGDKPPALTDDPSPFADAMTYAQVADAINKATAADTLDLAADLIGEIADAEQRKELSALVAEKRAKLEG